MKSIKIKLLRNKAVELGLQLVYLGEGFRKNPTSVKYVLMNSLTPVLWSSNFREVESFLSNINRQIRLAIKK